MKPLRIGAVALIGLSLVGCSSPKPEPPPERVSQLAGPIPAPPQTPPQTGLITLPVEGEPDRVGILARQAEQYAQNIGPVMAPKTFQAPPPLPAPVAPPVQNAESPAAALAMPVSDVQPAPTVTPTSTPMPTETAAPEPMTSAPAPTAQVAPSPAPQPPVEPVMASVDHRVQRTVIVPPEQDLSDRLARRAQDDPRDVAAHLDYQLAQFLNNQPVPEMTLLSTLPSEDREIIATLMDGLTNFRSGVRADPNMLLTRKVRPLLDMGDRLRAQADLTITKATLCSEVKDFGVYTEITPPRFAAGREHQVIIYCEVSHFASQLNTNSLWETKLTYEAVLYTDSEVGLPVDQHKPQTITDVCRSRRNDFFFGDKVLLPHNLTIGRYLLKVTVVDQYANRIAETVIPLQIVAK